MGLIILSVEEDLLPVIAASSDVETVPGRTRRA